MDLSQCGVGTKGLKALAAVLGGSNRSVTTLLLRRNAFGVHRALPKPSGEEGEEAEESGKVEQGGVLTPGVAALAAALRTNETLLTLDVGGNVMGPVNGKALVDSVAANAALTHVNLNVNRLCGTGQDGPRCPEDANNVAALLKSLSALLATRCTSDAAHRLTELHLAGNFVGPAGGEALAAALGRAVALQVLDLSHNNLQDQGVAALSVGLQAQGLLRCLKLADNRIGEDGVQKLCEATGHLQVLDVSDNPDVGRPQALKELTRLCKRGTLRTLNLSGSVFAPEVAAVSPLSDMLEKPSALEDLNASDTLLSGDALCRVCAALNTSGCAPIKSIDLWTRCGLTSKEWAAVLAAARAAVEKGGVLSLRLNPPATPELLGPTTDLIAAMEKQRRAADTLP